MFDLTGKNALVTGAGSGIGAAIARVLAAQGANVVLHCNASQDAARVLAEELCTAGSRASVLQADLRDGDAIKHLWREAEKEAPLDILVNNAGVLKNGFLAMTSDATWDETFDVNVKAAFALSKLAMRSMSRRKRGRIINISSRAAQMGDVMRAPYCASKAALLGLTKATAREVAAQNITCNAIAPGFIETAMTQDDDVRRDAQKKLVPLGRFGTPEEVAALALFLCSDEASYITGQCFGIDGGLLMDG
jgi:3-oxoacyl-[acyl-carrier protein] reductase